MAIPVPLILVSLKILESVARAQFSAGERKAELVSLRAKMESEHRAAIQRTDLDNQNNERQKEVMIRLIEAIEQSHKLKVESVLSVFRDARDLLRMHQNLLAKEKSELVMRLIAEGTTAQQHVLIMQRQSAIDTQLGEIDFEMAQLAGRAMLILRSCDPGLPMSRLAALTQDLRC